jgi:hypothetical protein
MIANDLLKEYSCTEVYYKFNSKCLLTDGAKAMADMFKCYWFLDVIASYQGSKLDNDTEMFQVWTMKVKDGKAVITCEDGNGNVVRKQRIESTDFEADEAVLWVEVLDQYHRVILLPSEH